MCCAGVYLVKLDVDMAWRPRVPPPHNDPKAKVPPTGGSRQVIAELFTWGDTVLKKDFKCQEYQATDDTKTDVRLLEVVKRSVLQDRLARKMRLCQEGTSSDWQLWRGFRPSDGTAFMDWQSWQANPDTLFTKDRGDPWPSPGGNHSRDIPLDQACVCQNLHTGLLQAVLCFPDPLTTSCCQHLGSPIARAAQPDAHPPTPCQIVLSAVPVRCCRHMLSPGAAHICGMLVCSWTIWPYQLRAQACQARAER